MQISSFEPTVKILAIDSIGAYQQYISPKKGFSCPHRVLYGNESCSDYVKSLLSHQSLTTVLKLSAQRFSDCAAASRALKVQAGANNFRCVVIPCCIPL